MKKGMKNALMFVSFAIVAILIVSGVNLKNTKLSEFKALKDQIQKFEETTQNRIAKGVITAPEGNIVVGLENNIGNYKSTMGTKAKVEIWDRFLKTKFIPGSYGGQTPRLDAVVPMHIDTDSLGGSTYIVLFNDRGDTVIEKSYARIGGSDVKIKEIVILPADESIKTEEYKIYTSYTYKSADKEVTIPVVDGHFVSEGITTE
jgi:hypothetical protein